MRDSKRRQHHSPHPQRQREADDGPIRLFGVHAVEAALRNPRRSITRLMLTENAEHRLADAVRARGLKSERVAPRDLDRMLGADTVHQGVLAEAEPLPVMQLVDIADSGSDGPLVVLDQVTDPHNVGAILRSAAVFGAAGLVVTRRHSPPLNGTLAKSASGALELVPVIEVQNLARALIEMGELAYTRIGLDGGASELIEDAPLGGRVALVLGAEGKGLRQLTGENCDRLCRIGATGGIGSLNVSNAAAVALHMCALQRRRATK